MSRVICDLPDSCVISPAYLRVITDLESIGYVTVAYVRNKYNGCKYTPTLKALDNLWWSGLLAVTEIAGTRFYKLNVDSDATESALRLIKRYINYKKTKPAPTPIFQTKRRTLVTKKDLDNTEFQICDPEVRFAFLISEHLNSGKSTVEARLQIAQLNRERYCFNNNVTVHSLGDEDESIAAFAGNNFRATAFKRTQASIAKPRRPRLWFDAAVPAGQEIDI